MEYLKGSLFDKDFMQTKATTARISGKERLWGHILGPGFTCVFYYVIMNLRELYYMDVVGINEVYGSPYTYLIMTVVTSILGIGTGFFINHMTEKTVCRAGRFRPYVLIGTWVMAVSGFCVFWAPFQAGTTPFLVWLYLMNFLYNCVGLPLYNLKSNMVSVTSRNVLERNTVTTIRSALSTMIAGIVVSLGITGMLYPTVLQHDLTGFSWIVTVAVTAVVAVVFSLAEYFWTRERITEDNQKILADQTGDAAIQVPFLQQMKNLLTDKYFLLATLVSIGMAFYSNLQGGNVRVNMITYILGGNEQNGLQMLYLMASMQPMAIGAVVVPLLATKFSARRIIQISAAITLAGVAIAMINPYSFAVAVAGGFVFAAGIFAITNMNGIFMQQASDELEYKYGYRQEGTLASGVISTIYTTLLIPTNALYETGLSLNGYTAGAMEQNQAVNDWILLGYYGSYALYAVLVFVVCFFFDAEKKMPMIHKALEDRARKAAEDRGEVYYTPQEQEQMEREAAAKELEEARIADLKAKCRKKGLDFAVENQKYLEKKAAKAAKRHKKKG